MALWDGFSTWLQVAAKGYRDRLQSRLAASPRGYCVWRYESDSACFDYWVQTAHGNDVLGKMEPEGNNSHGLPTLAPGCRPPPMAARPGREVTFNR